MAIAIVHVVGALAVWIAFNFLLVWMGAWEQERVKKRRLQDISIALGVPVASLEDDEHVARLIDYASRRLSNELLRNRLSDLCGLLRTAWGWLGFFAQVAVVLTIGWQIFDDGSRQAVLMWSVVGVALFFWLMSVGFSLVCLLLTGRYPGEANQGRNRLAKIIEQRDLPPPSSKQPETVWLG
jgi:hypothetical protein